MNNFIQDTKEKIKINKKKIIKRVSILLALLVVLGAVGVAFVFKIVNSNVNYTVEEAQEIALKTVPGQILRVNKDLELDNLSFEYKFKIKDANNMLQEVTVDSRFGTVVDIDNYYD